MPTEPGSDASNEADRALVAYAKDNAKMRKLARDAGVAVFGSSPIHDVAVALDGGLVGPFGPLRRFATEASPDSPAASRRARARRLCETTSAHRWRWSAVAWRGWGFRRERGLATVERGDHAASVFGVAVGVVMRVACAVDGADVERAVADRARVDDCTTPRAAKLQALR